jgi:hypothetical protein
VPVRDIWGLRRGITSCARGNVIIPVKVVASPVRWVGLAAVEFSSRSEEREARTREVRFGSFCDMSAALGRSAYRPLADISCEVPNFRFVPLADV